MTTGSQPRHFRRYAIRLPLLHLTESLTTNGTRAGWTRDLSEGGACAELDRPVPAQTQLRVRLQTDRGVIEAMAKVVWAGTSLTPGGGIPHGLAFDQITADQLEFLQYVFVTWGLTRWAGVRLPSEIAVTCQPKGVAGPSFQARTRDVSRAGLLLRAPQVMPTGTVVGLTLHTRSGPLTVDGEVIWVAPPEGRTPGGLIRHGLRFIALEWPTAVGLALELVEQLEGKSWHAPRGGRA